MHSNSRGRKKIKCHLFFLIFFPFPGLIFNRLELLGMGRGVGGTPVMGSKP